MLWGIIGPGVAGALFGAGWWFWVDAVVCSAVQVSFIHYLPGNQIPSLPLPQAFGDSCRGSEVGN